jgi:hypothetical protein
MKKWHSNLVFVCVLFIYSNNFAQQQDVSGVWKGLLYVDSTKAYLPYEIAISDQKKNMTGYSRIIFFEKGLEESGYEELNIKWKGDQLVVEDQGFFENNFTVKVVKRIKKTLLLNLIVSDTEMVLKGKWSTNRTRYYLAATGSIELKRKIDYKQTALYKKLDTLKLVEKLSFTKPSITTSPAIAAVAPTPVVIKPVIEIAKPVEDPDIIIPSIINHPVIATINIAKKPQPSLAKVAAPSKQKKLQMDALSKTVIKYTPKTETIAIAAPVAPKPQPIVAVAPAPGPEKKTAPAAPPAPKPAVAVVKTTTAPVEKKTAEIVAVAAPKPAPQIIIAPSLTQGAAEINKRTTKSDQTFYFDRDSLLLTLYDNGEVDGDTVTVLLNGGIVFSKQGLSTVAQTKTVYIPSITDSVSLVMYAESLGEIPPNTGLMIIMDGEKRYEVRFSADLKSNAGIILRRRKQEQ